MCVVECWVDAMSQDPFALLGWWSVPLTHVGCRTPLRGVASLSTAVLIDQVRASAMHGQLKDERRQRSKREKPYT